MRQGVRLPEAKTSNLHSAFESDGNGIGVVKIPLLSCQKFSITIRNFCRKYIWRFKYCDPILRIEVVLWQMPGSTNSHVRSHERKSKLCCEHQNLTGDVSEISLKITFFRYRKYGWPRISTIAIRILSDTFHCWRWQWWITNTFPFQCFYERSTVENWKSNPIPISQL